MKPDLPNPFTDLETIATHCHTLKASGHCVVMTNGCFDLLHAGHVIYLQEAAALGDYLIIGINSDASVRRLKGEKRPLISEVARGLVLKGLRCVDAVICFDDDTPINVLASIKPSIHVKGGDYSDVTQLPEYKTVIHYGGQVKCLSFVPGLSTSGIIQSIIARQAQGTTILPGD